MHMFTMSYHVIFVFTSGRTGSEAKTSFWGFETEQNPGFQKFAEIWKKNSCKHT